MKHVYLFRFRSTFLWMCFTLLTATLVSQSAPWPVTRLIDKSKASNQMPSIIDNAGNNRGACFDGQNIFVASRQNGNHVYKWNLADTSASPTELDITGVAGGTFVLSDLSATNNRLYLCNMVFVGGVFKVYSWNDVNTAPSVLLEYPMAPARLGDAMTVIGNPATNASLVVSGHGSKDLYVWSISKDTITDKQPKVVTLDSLSNVNFSRLNAIAESPGDFLLSGPVPGIVLLDSAMQVKVQVPPAFFPSWPLHADIFSFSGKRYLSYVHVKSNPAENARYILDISEGANVSEALTLLNQSTFADRVVYQATTGAVSNGNASVGSGYTYDQFGNILSFTYAAGNGFFVEKIGDKKPASIDPVTTVLDKSLATQNLPAIIDNAGNNRGACFNGQYTYVASRQNGNHIYYWDPMEPAADPKELNLTGVAGGTFVLSDLAAAGGQVFLSNMVFVGGAFKVYRWKNNSSEPEVVLEFPAAPARLGDAITVLGDPEKEAVIIASGHGTKSFYLWNITNGKVENVTPEVITFDDVTNVNFGRITAVQGETGIYLASGPVFGLRLLNDKYETLSTLTGAFLPSWPMDAHVFQYKGQRLLGYTHVKSNPAENAMYILDLTDGNSAAEAMTNLSSSSHAKKLIHQVNLGSVSNGNASVSTDFVTDSLGNVWALSFAAGNGFVLQQFGERISSVFENSPSQYQIFPNPASGVVTVRSASKIDQVSLFDMQGRWISTMKGGDTELTLPLNQVNSGIYLLQVQAGARIESHKIIVSH